MIFIQGDIKSGRHIELWGGFPLPGKTLAKKSDFFYAY
jgi:hypothetical protein